ncbi:MAG: hypothetical protein Q9190_005751 [Brigantiaea leucoxantha]
MLEFLLMGKENTFRCAVRFALVAGVTQLVHHLQATIQTLSSRSVNKVQVEMTRRKKSQLPIEDATRVDGHEKGTNSGSFRPHSPPLGGKTGKTPTRAATPSESPSTSTLIISRNK